MQFHSLEFIVFFILTVFLYFLLPHRHRWLFLLISSYYFYMCWKPAYLILIIFSTVVDYWLGLRMGGCVNKQQRKKYLILSIVVNLGLLSLFKYVNFFSASFNSLNQFFHIPLNVPSYQILLPVGISFYTFQSLSYIIDVYRGIKRPERHLGFFALYVAYFPQLVAGPIERSTHLLPQLHEEKKIDSQRISDGLKLMAWGYFKKVVVADRLAVIVNRVYNQPLDHSGFIYILATIFFAYQIYCDFSGYSDIAIGSARVMGINLMRNFNLPYLAASPLEFWRRWHISLSTWFKDYLYIPLGGNRVPVPRFYLNLLITFLLSGLWHGANWTFIIWGLLHASYFIVAIHTKSMREIGIRYIGLNRFPKFLQCLKIITTFSLVTLAWIFFRANTLPDALYIISHLFHGAGDIFKNMGSLGRGQDILGLKRVGFPQIDYLICLRAILLLEAIQYLHLKYDIRQLLSRCPWGARMGIYYLFLLIIIFWGNFASSAFIYFQF